MESEEIYGHWGDKMIFIIAFYSNTIEGMSESCTCQINETNNNAIISWEGEILMGYNDKSWFYL